MACGAQRGSSSAEAGKTRHGVTSSAPWICSPPSRAPLTEVDRLESASDTPSGGRPPEAGPVKGGLHAGAARAVICGARACTAKPRGWHPLPPGLLLRLLRALCPGLPWLGHGPLEVPARG